LRILIDIKTNLEILAFQILTKLWLHQSIQFTFNNEVIERPIFKLQSRSSIIESENETEE